jgi:hypothetical protein
MFNVDKDKVTPDDEPIVVSEIIANRLMKFNIMLLQKKLPYPAVVSPQFNVLY